MSEYVHLVGAEDVANAGRNISSAAADMNRAASYIDETLQRHERFLDDWLDRLGETLKEIVINLESLQSKGD